LRNEQRITPIARTGKLPVRSARRVLALEHFAIDLDVFLQIRRHVLFGKDRRHRAFGLACAAIDAFVGMDVELIRPFVNAVYRTHVYTGAVLRILAGFSYDVRHFVPDSAAAAAAAPETFPLRKIDLQI
jgi:hypothetical protein